MLELSKGRVVEYAAGLALGLSGDSSRSEALAVDLDKRFPEDTFVKFTYAPVLRALSALGRGKPADSVEQLEMARSYELGEWPQLPSFQSWRCGSYRRAGARATRQIVRFVAKHDQGEGRL